MKKPAPSRPGEINFSLVDRFTLVHFAIGVIYGKLGFSFLVAALLAVVWELVENPLKVTFPRLFPHATADTLKNSAGDTIAVLVGWSMFGMIWKVSG